METHNQCPSCGGELSFDPNSGDLKCSHCGQKTSFNENNTSNLKRAYDQFSSIRTQKATNTQYTCSSCGRTHISGVDNELTRCPSCGSPNLERTLNIEYIPDGVIPFKINQENAIQMYRAWIKKKKFAPNNLKRLAKLQGLTARYVPVYNYDFMCTSHYYGTGTETVGMGDNRRTRRIRFNDTRTDVFNNYLDSACSELSSHELRKFGNYNFGDVKVYKTEYLYGFIASQIQVDLHTSCANTRQSVINEIHQKIKSSLSCSIETFHCDTNFNYVRYNYLYVPMWTSVYKYKDKTYHCYINGQTGKASGRAPKSVWKILGVVLFWIAIGDRKSVV